MFGDGVDKLVAQITHDNPALNDKEVIDYAWSLIPEVTAYNQPGLPEDFTETAILYHEGYEAERRIRD